MTGLRGLGRIDKDTDRLHVSAVREVKVVTQTGVHQPEVLHQKTGHGKDGGLDTRWGGRREAADRISNSLASRPGFHQQHAHLGK